MSLRDQSKVNWDQTSALESLGGAGAALWRWNPHLDQISVTGAARDTAERLREAMERPLRIAGFDIHPTMSVGAASAEGGDDAPDATELLRRGGLWAGHGVRRLVASGVGGRSAGRAWAWRDRPILSACGTFDSGEVSGFEALAR